MFEFFWIWFWKMWIWFYVCLERQLGFICFFLSKRYFSKTKRNTERIEHWEFILIVVVWIFDYHKICRCQLEDFGNLTNGARGWCTGTFNMAQRSNMRGWDFANLFVRWLAVLVCGGSDFVGGLKIIGYITIQMPKEKLKVFKN